MKIYPEGFTKKEYEEAKAKIKKWNERKKKTLTRIRKEAKSSNERINITCAKLNAVRKACPGYETIYIIVEDTDTSKVKIRIDIDEI